MPYLIALCVGMLCMYVVGKLYDRDMSTYRTDDDAGALRDLILAGVLFAILASPFAALWWIVMSAAMAARH